MKKPTNSQEEAEMSDKPLRWPTHGRAKEARDIAAEQAIRGIRALQAIVEGRTNVNEIERLHQEAIALNALQLIIRLMEEQGAPTIPCQEL
jgi:hypothetical protein